MHYIQEWAASGVDAELTRLNVRDLRGGTPYEYLLYAEPLPRRNDGRLQDGILRRYQHIEAGGWWCSGIDLLSGQEDSWGCFKPVEPRTQPGKNKIIKYEHPPQTSTGVFALRVPLHIWDAIATRYHQPFSHDDVDLDQPDRGFWQWLLAHPEIPLCLTEGAKKAGALLTAGFAAIALPGVHGGYRVLRNEAGEKIGKARLIPQLALLARQNRPIYLAFDQDTKPKTIKAVQGAIRQTAYLLHQQGCPVHVITWRPEQGKGVDDLIMRHGTDAFVTTYENALTFEAWKAQTFAQLTYPAAQIVNARYLPPLSIPPGEKLIALKSPKGTGKTRCLEQVVKDAIAQGQWVLVIGHRVRLVESLCQRFGLQYISELDLRENPDSRVAGFGLCIDSLHPNSQARFNAADWQDGVVIIDEIEQVLWHGLNSSTCRGNRVAILKSLKTLMQNVLGGQGQVYVADADLSDVSLDYLRALAGCDVQPYVVENQWRPGNEAAWTVQHYADPTPDRLVQALENHIREGGKPFVCLSAQKRQSQWGTSNLEAYLHEKFPDRAILRLDSDTLTDVEHPASQGLNDLDARLQAYDIVLSSPCLETGVSIDLRGHFTSVWAIAQGVQAENSVRQSLSRVRENVPRHVWIAPFGFNTVGNGSSSIPELLDSGQKLTQLNIRLLQQSDLTSLDDLETGFQAESLLCWARLAVRCNAAMSKYRETVLAALKLEGHHIETVGEFTISAEPGTFPETTESSPSLGAAVAEVRDRNYQEDCDAIATAADISYQQYRTLKKQLVKTPEQRRQTRKYELIHRYGMTPTAELVMADDQGWYGQLRLHYYLTVGRDYLTERDAAIAQQLLNQGQGSVFPPDFNQSQLGAKIGTFDTLGITNLLTTPERPLRNTDPDLITLQDQVIKNRSFIKSVLGIGIAKNASPVVIVRRFIELIGYELEFIRCETQPDPKNPKKKKRIRIYQIAVAKDARSRVFQYWLHHETKNRPNFAQWEDELPVQPVAISPHSDPIDYEQLSLW